MEPLAVDLREAARLTSLSMRSLRRYIKTGRIRGVRIGRRVLIPLDSLRRLLQQGAAQAFVKSTESDEVLHEQL
jgi:excisionase family DNA binding protein